MSNIQALESARDIAKSKALASGSMPALATLRSRRVELLGKLSRTIADGGEHEKLDAELLTVETEFDAIRAEIFSEAGAAQIALTTARRTDVAANAAYLAEKLSLSSVTELTIARHRLTAAQKELPAQLRAVASALDVATKREELLALVVGMSDSEKALLKSQI